MLGHTDAGFTMNTYMHVTDDMQKNAADQMKNLIDNSGKDTKKIKFPA
jgi:integrase